MPAHFHAARVGAWGNHPAAYLGLAGQIHPLFCASKILSPISQSKSGGENKFECWEVHGEESGVFPDASGCMWEGDTTVEQRERERERLRLQEFELDSLDQCVD